MVLAGVTVTVWALGWPGLRYSETPVGTIKPPGTSPGFRSTPTPPPRRLSPTRTEPPPDWPEASTAAPDSTTSRPKRSITPPTEPVTAWRPLLYKRPALLPSMTTWPPGPVALLAETTAAVEWSSMG